MLIAPSSLSFSQDQALGGSRTSKVFRGTWNWGSGQQVVAVKLLASDASVEDLANRIERWESLKHPNILETFGMSEDPLAVVLQCCGMNGNIRQYMTKNPRLDRTAINLEIALGMQYIHSNGMAHGGLKASNVLITDDGHACVGDYGLVEVQTSKSNDAHRYFSPEAWKGTISKSSDVFAFAMTAYEVFSGAPPWGVLAEKHIYQHIVHENVRPDRPDDVPDHLWSIVEESWTKEARLRPSFDIIVRMWSGEGRPQPLREESMDSHTSGPPAYTDVPSSDAVVVPPFSPVQPLNFLRPPPVAAIPSSPSPSMLSHSSRVPSSEYPSSEDREPPLPSRPQPQPRSRPPSLLRPRDSMTKNVRGSSSNRRTHQFMPSLSQSPERPESRGAYSEPPTRGGNFYAEPLSRATDVSEWEANHRRFAQPWISEGGLDDTRSMGASSTGQANAVLLVTALQAEVNGTRKREPIDMYLTRIQHLAAQNDKDAQKLVTAGVIPTLIQVLKLRAVGGDGLEVVLITLGLLAHDSISANTIYRTNTSQTLVEIFSSALSDEISALSIWCLNRICRTADIANGLVKQNLATLLASKGLSSVPIVSRQAAWCLGSLVHTDAIADIYNIQGLISPVVEHLRLRSASPEAVPEDIHAALYPVARVSRSIKLAKTLSKWGCIPLLAHHMARSDDPGILNWCARAVGCLMRPNSGDMAKALLEAGIAQGLARIPSVLHTEDVEPLASFAFAVQRFSCAEWGGGVRKSLVEAGVVDALLATLRTAADEPWPQVHVELALAVSFLGDVGGGAIRKEIVSAGGIDILKRVGKEATTRGDAEVGRTCDMAVKSITGNLWTRNAASAKTAMNHNWSGGCPDWQPPCPYELMELEEEI